MLRVPPPEPATGGRTRHWIAVASREHALLGVKGGFAQFSHGKPGPAKRPAKGDWLIYYSGKLVFGHPEPCQRFVAIGRVEDSTPNQVDQGPSFKPWRRKVRYESSVEVDIRPLIPSMSFIRNKARWSTAFRFGLLEIGPEDFNLIASQMIRRDSSVAS